MVNGECWFVCAARENARLPSGFIHNLGEASFAIVYTFIHELSVNGEINRQARARLIVSVVHVLLRLLEKSRTHRDI